MFVKRVIAPNRRSTLQTTMSRPYGSFSRRGSGSRRNEHGKRRDATSQSGSSQYEHHGRPQGRGNGPPPWLKGKELGLYYRDKAKQKRKKATSRVIKLPPNLQQDIERVLDNSKGFYEKLYNSDLKAGDSNSSFEDKYTHVHDSEFKRKFLKLVSGNIQESYATAPVIELELQRDSNIDNALLNEYKSKQHGYRYKDMIKVRSRLPSYSKKSEILQLIKDNQVVVVTGETGCGKTTQVAQFILDDQIEEGNGSITRIICTQPRRISAISVAERVAAERIERLGTSVGFQIRLEKVLPRHRGSILFCTTGILLQFLQENPLLKDFSHIIMDEIHERSTQCDFMIALLKLILPKRPDLKVLLMSATLNADKFSKYYDDCPMIHIAGVTYPVQEFYLEDVLSFTNFKFPPPGTNRYRPNQVEKDSFSNHIYLYINQLKVNKTYSRNVIEQLMNPRREEMSLDLIETLIRYICATKDPGAILVFLPGMEDIKNLHRIITNSGQYPQSQYVVYPIHSRMPTIDQKLIFNEPPAGVRKIIISTSIAETSITIEDVVYVIDCGRTKFLHYDVKQNIQILQSEWVSLANAKQRKGRAGRIKPGYCYHLYLKVRETVLEKYPLPEILRTRLEEVILQIKMLQLGEVRPFLSSVMDPPNYKTIDVSLDVLKNLNALDNEENLTPLGYHLAKLPVDPRIGKMLIWAALFSCVQPVFAIAASLSFKDAFYTPYGLEDKAMERKLKLSGGQFSDHLTLAAALRIFEDLYQRGHAGDFCRRNFLSFSTLKLLLQMKYQLVEHLHEMKFLETKNPTDYNANRNSDNEALVKAIVCAGLYPNIAVIESQLKYNVCVTTPEDGRVYLHRSSVLYNQRMEEFPSPIITYFRKQRSSGIFIYDATCVTAPILLFGAPHLTIKKKKGTYFISLSHSQNFQCDLRSAELIQKLHEELNNMLEYKITHPETVSWKSHEGDLLNVIITLVGQEDQEMELSNSDVEESENSRTDCNQ